MKRGLTSMYDRLTAEERFQLVVEAFAREDEREAERLSNACPPKAYKMKDLNFINRLRASDLMVFTISAELMEVLSALRTIEACKEALEKYEEIFFSYLEQAIEEAALCFQQGWDLGCDHAWQAAGKNGPFPWNDKANLSERTTEMARRIRAESRSETSDGSRQDTLERISGELSMQARTIWEAFSRFCREHTGLEPETVLRACFPPAPSLLKELKDLVGSAQTDPALLENYEATLVSTWYELVGT